MTVFTHSFIFSVGEVTVFCRLKVPDTDKRKQISLNKKGVSTAQADYL